MFPQRLLGRAVMGMHEKEPKMADAYGIPEYFATHVRTEDAGGGCIRIYNCTLRGGLLIPQYTVVFPAMLLVTSAKKIYEISKRAFVQDGWTAH